MMGARVMFDLTVRDDRDCGVASGGSSRLRSELLRLVVHFGRVFLFLVVFHLKRGSTGARTSIYRVTGGE